MKSYNIMIFIALLVFLPLISYSSDLGTIRLSLIDGDVQIKTEETGDWVPASINMPLKDGDQLWVPEGGKAEVRLLDGTVLRLNEATSLDILTVDQNSYQFYLAGGRAYVNFRGSTDGLLQLDTPAASIRAYNRSSFKVDVTGDGYTDTSVYSGSVYAETGEGRTTIEAGNGLTLREKDYADLYPLGSPDDWETWNRERDQRYLAGAPSSTNLPEEIDSYSSELEENGKWVNVADYGYVWTPTVVASADWAPYRSGRWVWIGGDYVWVSYEPWGWLPYHYGRWAHAAAVGWFWVPPARGDVFWGPGYVGWVYTPTYVSWVPLAPGEIYYGHRHHGRHSVNITTINVTSIEINRIVYRNIHVHNAVTVIHRETFVTGRRVPVPIRENPFLKERISIGRPDIKPVRTSMIPVIKEIPQIKRPPQAIREMRVKEIRAVRPLVREKEVSVFRPGISPRPMNVRPVTGRPVETKIERPVGPKPIEREGLKPREKRTVEKSAERERKPLPPIAEKAQERKPVERESLKPREPRQVEKAGDRPTDRKPLDRSVEKTAERKPVEKEGLKPREKRTVDKAIDKIEDRRPPERKVEKAGEKADVPKETGKVSREVKPLEKRPVITRESPPKKFKGDDTVRPKESKPAGTEKPSVSKPVPRVQDRPAGQQPSGTIQKPAVQPSSPPKAPARPVEPKTIHKSAEKPVQAPKQPSAPQRPAQTPAQPPSQPPSQPKVQSQPPAQPHVQQKPVQQAAPPPVQQRPAPSPPPAQQKPSETPTKNK